MPYIFCCNKNLKHNNLQKRQDLCLFLDFQYFAKKAVFYAFSAGVNCCAGNGLPHFPASSACRVLAFTGFLICWKPCFRLLHPRACTHRVRNTGYLLHTLGYCAKHNLQNRCKRNWKTIFKGNLFSFGACAKKHMAYRKKYKPCILKYKALISKYVPYIFCHNNSLTHNNLQTPQFLP